MTGKLGDLATDFFATVFAFRAATNDERPPYRTFRQEVEDLLSDFERRAERERLDSRADARYALVALVDETVLASNWEDADEWRDKPLAIKEFQDANAGEVFFDKLERLQRGEDQEVLEIYYTCLCAGFRGKYRDDPGTLRSLRNRIYGRIITSDPLEEGKLTPDAYGHDLERPLITRRFPLFWAVPFVLGTIGLYGAFYFILSQQVREISRDAVTAPVANSVPAAAPPN
jgi:type VI secretion system protein ImpK